MGIFGVRGRLTGAGCAAGAQNQGKTIAVCRRHPFDRDIAVGGRVSVQEIRFAYCRICCPFLRFLKRVPHKKRHTALCAFAVGERTHKGRPWLSMPVSRRGMRCRSSEHWRTGRDIYRQTRLSSSGMRFGVDEKHRCSRRMPGCFAVWNIRFLLQSQSVCCSEMSGGLFRLDISPTFF